MFQLVKFSNVLQCSSPPPASNGSGTDMATIYFQNLLNVMLNIESYSSTGSKASTWTLTAMSTFYVSGIAIFLETLVITGNFLFTRTKD